MHWRAISRALEIRQRLAESDPRNMDWQRDLAVSFGDVGDMERENLDFDAALNSFARSHEITERLNDLDPSNTSWRRDLTVFPQRNRRNAARHGRSRCGIGEFSKRIGNRGRSRRNRSPQLGLAKRCFCLLNGHRDVHRDRGEVSAQSRIIRRA
jgi:hypothetical protein